MFDVRIVHDRCGSYADWYGAYVVGRTTMAPAIKTHDYLIGRVKPRYPVPAVLCDVTIWRSVVIIDYWPRVYCDQHGWITGVIEHQAIYIYKQ